MAFLLWLMLLLDRIRPPSIKQQSRMNEREREKGRSTKGGDDHRGMCMNLLPPFSIQRRGRSCAATTTAVTVSVEGRRQK
jgi:hypothetical protein